MTDDEKAIRLAYALLPATGVCHWRWERGAPAEVVFCDADAVGQYPNGGQYCAEHLVKLDAWAEREL